MARPERPLVVCNASVFTALALVRKGGLSAVAAVTKELRQSHTDTPSACTVRPSQHISWQLHAWLGRQLMGQDIHSKSEVEPIR